MTINPPMVETIGRRLAFAEFIHESRRNLSLDEDPLISVRRASFEAHLSAGTLFSSQGAMFGH